MTFFGRGVLLGYHLPVFEAPLPTELESQKRKASPWLRYRHQTGLLCVKRHADIHKAVLASNGLDA